MEIWIVIIIIVTVIYYFNKQKPQQRTSNSDVDDWVETHDKEELLNLLKNTSGFTPSKIIESKQAFYAFGLDTVNRKIAFVTGDLATLIIKFEDIVSSKISQLNTPNNVISYSSRIYLDIQRNHFNTPTLRIECFNGDKLANRFIDPIKNPLMQQAIYNNELKLATEINNIINQVKDRKTEKINTPPPPPKQTIIIPPSEIREKIATNTNSETVSQPEKPDLKTIQVTFSGKESNETGSRVPKFENIGTGILDNSIQKVVNEIIEGKTKFSIEDIEKQSKGLLLDHELVSIINDARMRGLTEVYIPDEKIGNLFGQESKNIIDNSLQGQSDIVYKPINYQTTYQEKDINNPLHLD